VRCVGREEGTMERLPTNVGELSFLCSSRASSPYLVSSDDISHLPLSDITP
jgi:hypothetical protein